MNRLTKLALVPAALAILTMQGPASAGKADDTVVWATASQVDITDVYYQNQREVVITALNMCDSLLHLNPETYEYVPLLATGYKWKDSVTLDLDLREGVKYWDGRDFSAKDVAYSLNHARQPDSAVAVRQIFDWIKDVEVLDDYKVRIHAVEPTPAALAYLADETPIYPEGHYDDAPPLTTKEGETKRDYGAVEPMCTGPYMLDEFNPGSGFTLVKNPNYFEGGPKGQPDVGKLVYKTIADTDSQLASMMTGDVDWIWSVLPQNVAQLEQVPTLEIKAAPTMRVSFLSLDSAGLTGESPLQDRKVRQAIAHAIDRQAIVDNLLGPGAEVVNSMCAPVQVACSEDVHVYDYDPERAKELLAEAGYPDGFELPIHGYRDRPYTESVMSYLREVGIRTDLRYLQWKALRPKLRNKEVTFAHLSWGSQGIMDATASTGYYFTFGPDDLTHDEEIRDWLVEADTIVEEDERAALYEKALQKIADQAYYLPLFLYNHIYAINADLDYTVTPDELAHFYMAKWK